MKLAGVALVAHVVAGIACGGNPSSPAVGLDASAIPIDPREVVVGIGEETFPSESLRDWVSYAVQVSELTVLSEAVIPPPVAVLERGEGYIGRRISVRVERTFFTSTGARTPGAGAGPVDIVVSGWILRGTRRVLFALEGAPRLEVGGRYIMPLITMLRPDPDQRPEPRTSRTDGSMPQVLLAAWGPLALGAIFPAFGDPLASADVTARGHSSLARTLSSLSAEALIQVLAETVPDPRAVAHWHLPPYERWQAAARTGGP